MAIILTAVRVLCLQVIASRDDVIRLNHLFRAVRHTQALRAVAIDSCHTFLSTYFATRNILWSVLEIAAHECSATAIVLMIAVDLACDSIVVADAAVAAERCLAIM
jgi:hypothetical protein